MPHPSGSEDIPRAHWLAGLVFWTLCPVSLGALVWLNLARVAASAWPGPRGDRMLGTLLMAITRPERVGQVWAILTNGRAALHGVLAGMLRHTPPDPLRVWWLEWWQFALTHMLGSPPVARGIAVNTAGAAMALVGAGVLSRLLTQTRAFDGRIGTSRWASPKDLRPFTRAARRPGALPLGRIARRRNGAGTGLALPLRDAPAHVGRFSHIAVIGVTEAGKTSSVFKPWLLADAALNDPRPTDRDGWPARAMSSIAVDMKHPDLYEALAPYIAPHARRLLVLAPGSPSTSLSYNPLDFLGRDAQDPGAYMQDITALAESIVINTPLGYRDDAYYQSIETKLLELLIQFVCDADATGAVDSAFLAEFIRPVMAPGASPQPLRSLPMVAYLAALPYPELFGFITRTQTDPGQPASRARRMAQVMGMSKDHETGILLGLSRRVRVFTLPEVAGVSARSDFSLDLVGRQPGTLLIGMPRHSGQSMETYSALIVTQLLQQLKRLASSSGGRLPVPVTIYLDEIATQGRIPGLERDLATLRDLGAAFALGLQNTSALARRYGREGMADMLSNTNTKIVLGKNLGAEDAEAFARLSGNTTILTPSVSIGRRGNSRGLHAARRELITADQIRSMRQFEALVFLQTCHVAHTMLRPFHQLDLHRLPSIPHFARGGTTREGITVPPSILLLHRHRELDRDLGPWDVRPLKRAAEPAPAPAAQAEPDPEVERLVAEATAHRSSMQADGPAAKPSPRAGARNTEESTETPLSEEAEMGSAAKAASAASPEARQTAGTPSHDHAMDEVRGFLRAALMRQDLPVADCSGGAPTAWRVRTTKNDVSMAVRHALVEAYAARRGTRAEKMLHQWRETGLVEPSDLQIADGPGRGPVPAVVLTAKALGRDRLTPALLDKIAALPELSPQRIAVRKGGRSAHARGKPSGRPPQSVSRSGDPHRALRAVVRWAEEHREALVIPAGEPIGRWEAVTNGIPVLLVRGHELMRLLSAEHAETREILGQWKHTGVIVTADNAQDTHDNRFTVFMRPGEGTQSGTRYIAIRWEHLERAGLSRRSPARPMMIP